MPINVLSEKNLNEMTCRNIKLIAQNKNFVGALKIFLELLSFYAFIIKFKSLQYFKIIIINKN